jgi:PLP dependent protein
MNKLKNKNIKLHFIGHLQTNKVKEVLNYVDVIQSVDTLKLAKKISQESENRGKVTEIYLQINSTDEPQKHGFIPSQITTLWPELTVLPGITITGLMCMGKQSDLIATRSAFKKCKKLCRKLNLLKCSMGMSSDYAIALEEGSTMVRIGSAIFNQDELEREG